MLGMNAALQCLISTSVIEEQQISKILIFRKRLSKDTDRYVLIQGLVRTTAVVLAVHTALIVLVLSVV